MNIGIDLRCLPADGSPGGGIAHAARAISRAMAAREATVWFVPQGARPDDGSPGSGCSSSRVLLPDASRRTLLRALHAHACDAFFVPSGAVPFGLPIPAYPWIHDLDIFSHPEWFPQSFFRRALTTHMVLRGMRRAPAVFAVSAYAKRQCIERGLLDPATIRVTGEGGDAILAGLTADSRAKLRRKTQSILMRFGIARPYMLILGTAEPRKNIPFIARIWPQVSRVLPGIDLVIAGRDGWRMQDIPRALEDARISAASDILRVKNIEDDERRALLLHASLVLVPSLSEGFGLVALEAAQAGVPVLLSNRGALPEILGEGEWCLDPEDDALWVRAMVRIIADTDCRLSWLSSQAESAKRWSWMKAADSILRGIRETYD